MIAAATGLKADGNAAFKDKSYDKAVRLYGKAIEQLYVPLQHPYDHNVTHYPHTHHSVYTHVTALYSTTA
jgi:hypothetical protein